MSGRRGAGGTRWRRWYRCWSLASRRRHRGLAVARPPRAARTAGAHGAGAARGPGAGRPVGLTRTAGGADPDERGRADRGTAALALAPPPRGNAARQARQRQERTGESAARRRPPPARRNAGRRPAAPGPPERPAAAGPGHARAPAVAATARSARREPAEKKAPLAAVTHAPAGTPGQARTARPTSHPPSRARPAPRTAPRTSEPAATGQRAHPAGENAHTGPPDSRREPRNTPVTAATSEISRGRIETRTIRVLPAPEGPVEDTTAVLIERYTTSKKKGNQRAEAVLYITSLAAEEATPEDLLACIRGHWRVEHTHWLRDVIWKEDKSLIRTGNGPQVWSAFTNFAITLFRIHGVTAYTAETRRNAQDPPRTRIPRHNHPLTSLNAAQDFDESLYQAPNNMRPVCRCIKRLAILTACSTPAGVAEQHYRFCIVRRTSQLANRYSHILR